jgi:hypothetical protein
MKRKGLLIFLVLVISGFTVVLPAYFGHSNLKRAKLLPADLSFESLDEESLLDDRQKQPKEFVSSVFLIILYLGTKVSKPISCLSYPTFSLDQTFMILRC